MEHVTKLGIFMAKEATGRDVESFLNAHRDWVFRLAIQLVGVRELAEDVAQDSLIRASRSLHQLRDGAAQTAWLRKIVVRRAMTALAQRRELAEAPEAVVEPSQVEDLAVRQTLARLSVEQQMILALAIGEQLSYQEVGDALGIPVGTVGSRLHAAKAAFRKLWGDER